MLFLISVTAGIEKSVHKQITRKGMKRRMEFIRKKQYTAMLDMEKDGVRYLQFPAFTKSGVCRHLFSTRIGGVSTGDIGTMNLSYSRGDLKENVDENFRRIAGVLGCDISDFVLSQQTHTTNVRLVTVADKGKGVTCVQDYRDVDGLITNEPGIVLSTFYADCVPLFFVDPIKKVIGLSHSGWRGTVGKIGKVTVEKMTGHYGCNPEDILAAVGPSICADCYEVSMDVADEFKNAFSEVENRDKIILPKSENKAMLDLWQANLAVLLQAGIRKEHITLPDICTACNKELLFSHRASGGKRGNMGAFLVLN